MIMGGGEERFEDLGREDTTFNADAITVDIDSAPWELWSFFSWSSFFKCNNFEKEQF